MFACLHVCMFVCLHVCLFACLYVCIYKGTRVQALATTSKLSVARNSLPHYPPPLANNPEHEEIKHLIYFTLSHLRWGGAEEGLISLFVVQSSTDTRALKLQGLS